MNLSVQEIKIRWSSNFLWHFFQFDKYWLIIDFNVVLWLKISFPIWSLWMWIPHSKLGSDWLLNQYISCVFIWIGLFWIRFWINLYWLTALIMLLLANITIFGYGSLKSFSQELLPLLFFYDLLRKNVTTPPLLRTYPRVWQTACPTLARTQSQLVKIYK